MLYCKVVYIHFLDQRMINWTMIFIHFIDGTMIDCKKNSNDFISFGVYSLEIYSFSISWIFWVEQHLSTPFLKPIKPLRQEKFSRMGGLTAQTSSVMNEAFFSKLRNNNTIDKNFKVCQSLRSNRLVEQQALKKLQIKSVSASGWENYK